jgi:hypothetical protein
MMSLQGERMHYKLSKNEWLAIGEQAGWLKSGVSRPNEKTAAGPDSELYRKLQKIYGYVANEANDISDNQWKKWSISVDAGMSSDDEKTKELAKLIKAIVDDFNSEGDQGPDDRYYSGTGESMDDQSYERYLNRG